MPYFKHLHVLLTEYSQLLLLYYSIIVFSPVNNEWVVTDNILNSDAMKNTAHYNKLVLDRLAEYKREMRSTEKQQSVTIRSQQQQQQQQQLEDRDREVCTVIKH